MTDAERKAVRDAIEKAEGLPHDTIGYDRVAEATIAAYEAARAKAEPPADMMERAREIGREMREECGMYHVSGVCKIAAALAEARRKALGQALKILHEEGWLGHSEQRLRALIEKSGDA